ncbi:MAG: DUF4276 family protein [Epsilonproteobacteria bacterium]|nr:DUF4276 family protein [Campylobacterota bacterium]OIO17488.1 MAG: hypothetical protein AUJ81_02150 [Helicobacteraceae bacterium CG1_02_36_14]PIP10730.1 MAG: hypothetical protein COX50_04540 [Sulfurimonas sp. CG23_combo_of_CG06-09_8_20_14_all_36_33]PIS25064.1 MAG: hypothetical protein COT46_07480 [Sulfurimonas sp. CG08_land_8_20_14_0_20_36_33]PIU35194.1 MAG: hypothetical protein COT05_04680 [Sulfurimonas sp. CG07_land_8_20_14_0_80_36_56]PIV03217.1 MAG: hypothetical protein COS56_09540 [Sulf
MKIGLIVEGDSDKLFFEKYFKLNFKKNIIVVSPGKKGTCRILNKQNIHKDVQGLLKRGCEKVYILVDLDTQCDNNRQFDCILELKEWYKEKIQIQKLENTLVAIVAKEIESWMLSAWENSDNKSKEDFKKKFNEKKKLTEEDLVKKFLSSKKDIQKENNKSLKYFLEKLGI